MKKIGCRAFLSIVIIAVSLIVYTIWDNNRIIVVKEDVEITSLANGLEDFTILQISDLHEKYFGRNQRRLIKKINSINYDVIVITGDILSGVDSTNYDPFYKVLEGITNRDNIFYVSGNADPSNYEISPQFGKSEFIRGMEEREGLLLESFKTIDKDGESIHFVDFELSIVKNPELIGNINGMIRPFHAGDEEYLAYQKGLWEEMINEDILESDSPVIALNHAPAPDPRIDYIEKDPNTEWRDYDLILAGHYHGGQIRLPLVGALFIPDPWYEPNSFFPPQDRVKGLWEYKQTKQYVSAGLGSSDAISFAKFRLFNPPEINLLTLKRE